MCNNTSKKEMVPVFLRMRREERRISTAEARQILLRGDYGVLSLHDDEFPYGVPLNYVYMDEALYFHCAEEGHKLRCLSRDPRVSFCVTGRIKALPQELTTAYESVIVFGRASCVEGEEKRRALLALTQKYAPGYIQSGIACIEKATEKVKVVKIEIISMSGKGNRLDLL